MSAGVDTISAMLEQAWASGRQADVGSTAEPGSAQEAYAVQDRVFAARHAGRRASAWKAGGAKPGAELSAAPIGIVLASPAEVSAKPHHMLIVETEIAFRLRSDLPARDAGWSDHEIAAAIGEALVTIELCDTRLADWKSASALWRLADFQLNAALVTGSGVRDWRKVAFGAQEAELWVNGTLRVGRKGSHTLGDPFNVMPWIVEHCARRGGLKSGDVVTTGSWTGMEHVAPGDSVLARFPGIGEASLKIAA